MSALSLDDARDPRNLRYYAPRGRRVAAREATLQPVLERLRGSARAYSAEERLSDDADPITLPEPEFVLVPDRRIPFAALAGFAGALIAVGAVAVAYIAGGVQGASAVAARAPSPPQAAQVSAAPAKIDARMVPNQPVSQAHAETVPVQVQTANPGAPASVDPSKGDRLDASANPRAATPYNPLQSPLSLWSMVPTQAAIEGADPALGAPAAQPPAPQAAAATPRPAAPEQHARPAEHHVVRARHHVRHVRHVRHRVAATTGTAASANAGQTAAAANGAAAQPPATKKFLGLFGS